MEIQRTPEVTSKKNFSRQQRSAMNKFFRTCGLPTTVRFIEEYSLVNMFSVKFKQFAIFQKKMKPQKNGRSSGPQLITILRTSPFSALN